jgi:predicted RNA-binding Zn-ribbon protein involved in translation (DUF1610 family)
MKYAEYCPECYKRGLESKLTKTGSKLVCENCGWNDNTVKKEFGN